MKKTSFFLIIKSLLILFIVVSFLLSSCKEDQHAVPVEMGYTYFPVNIGHTIVYNFDSVFIDTKVGMNETLHYQLKEYVESVFNDNTGRPTQRIERYVRATDTATWKIKNVFAATLTRSAAERVEDNQRYIKLIFPVKQNDTWKGNSYTTQADWEYEYTSVDERLTLNGTTFDSTLTVVHVNEVNLIEKNYSIEKYARHVGLIYKEQIYLERTPAGVVTKASVAKYTYKSFIP